MFIDTIKYCLCLFFRYLNLYPEDNPRVEKWEEALKDYIAMASQHEQTEEKDLLEIQPSLFLTLEEQFRVISLLPNNPFAIYPTLDGKMSSVDANPSHAQHLLYQLGDNVTEDKKAKYNPTSMRNRLFYFQIHQEMGYVRRLCRHVVLKLLQETGDVDASDDLGESFVDNHSQSAGPAKKRRVAPRVVKDSPMEVDNLAKNVSLERSLYVNFREQVLTSGHVSVRSSFQDGGVILMNDYNDGNGFFLPSSYAHVSFHIINDIVSFDCSCSSSVISQQSRYMEQLQISSSCMHCRFAQEYLLDVCKKPISIQDMTGRTNLEKKLQETYCHMNDGVVIISDSPTSAVKMSVRGQDGLCSFVHLSVCRKYVSCQQGSCQAAMRNRKKTLTLLCLDSHNKICQHLQTLHCNREIWQPLVPSVEELKQTPALSSEPQNIEDRNINVKVMLEMLFQSCVSSFY